MDTLKWMIAPYLRYADFKGRSCRKEYWMFQLFLAMGVVAIVCLGAVLPSDIRSRHQEQDSWAHFVAALAYGLFVTVFVLGSFIPWLALHARRFHDLDRSGLWFLLHLFPMGSLIVFVAMCVEGTQGANRYGDDPLQIPKSRRWPYT